MATPFELPAPLNLKNLEDVARWGEEVIQAIETAWNEQRKYLELVEIHAEPSRLYDGLTVLADGTNWNPGSGQGVYTYYNSGWHKLG
jgi:hypothetical protein